MCACMSRALGSVFVGAYAPNQRQTCWHLLLSHTMLSLSLYLSLYLSLSLSLSLSLASFNRQRNGLSAKFV
jgi:7-keto-8-aminopelargonate synthetase-like enzyme